MLIFFLLCDVCFLISIRLPLCTGLLMLYLFSSSMWELLSRCPEMDFESQSLIIYDQNKKIQTFMESMTRMFPMTVIRLRVPATRMMSTISTIVYWFSGKRSAVIPLLELAV